MEYINIGTDKILREYMCDVIDTDTFYKPAGGLWCTGYDSRRPDRSKWLDYMLCYPRVYCQKMDKAHPFTQKGVIIDVDDSARIFNLIGQEAFDEFKAKYGRNGHVSYEELSKHYDAVYIDSNKPFGDTRDQLERFYRIYAVDSLCIFDLDVIKDYRKVDIDVEPFDYECSDLDTWPEYTMTISDEKKKIAQLSAQYMELYNKVLEYYRNVVARNDPNASNYKLVYNMGREILERFAAELQKLKEAEQLDESKVAYAMATKALRRNN